jgi:RNA-binding protein 26
MRFPGDDEHKIQNWISKQLQSVRQNNPDEVAKYVMSVLKREEKDVESLRIFCADDLRQFLKEKTTKFVDLLFSAIKDGSYRRSSSDDEVDYNEVMLLT